MKKIQLFVGTFLMISCVFAQKAELSKNNFAKTSKKVNKTLPASKSSALWSDDFSDASTWTLGHASSCDLDWQIGLNLSNSGAYPTDPVLSTSAANGYAMLDSDAYGADGSGDLESSWMTTASPINLSGTTNIILNFETNYRQFDTQCFIVTSTNNTDWPDLNVDFDASTNPNVYALWEDFGNNDGVESNPTTVNVNISGSAGGQSQVWVRFHHTGTWGYSWFVDDVSISPLQENDIVLNEAWASTFLNSEYGRTPISQLSDSLALGGEMLNFGSATQTGIELLIEIENSAGATLASNTEIVASLEQDSTALLQTAVPVDLAEGVYTLNATLTSDADNANGDYFENNTYSREFAITKNLYSLDGIDVYDEEDLSVTSLGTGNTGAGEGNTLFARYVILEETSIVGLEVAISSQSTTGGQIFSFLLPESSLLNEDGSLNQSADVYSGRIAENEDGVTVTQNNIDNNLVFIPLPETTLAPGVYYACAELYTAGGNEDALQVLDDETVWEPFYASLFFTADDQTVYTNGTALAIRMALGDYVNLDENENNTLFSVVPNPSNGVFTVTTDKNDFYTLDVVNVLGEVISSKTIEGAINETIDISSFDAGIYLVKVTTSTSQNVQRVVIK